MKHVEIEDKFVIAKAPENVVWEKAVMVYQFFCEEGNGKVQDKVAVNMLKGTVSLCTVTKEILDTNKSSKQTDYRDFSLEDCKKHLGSPFVMKRRMIKGNIFLDKYIYAQDNITSKYMLEIEHEESDDLKQYKELLEGAERVSGNEEYYNENMTVTFEEKHLEELGRFIELFVN